MRLRVEGERSALPGPALTPYLVGLLVLLGMLGTFVGMVVTLNGAVMALESTTDLAAIRAALAAPVRGLGLAFGTSVAGVAASAMLGLASALLRRERLQAAHSLDARIATTLRPFSLAHQRERTLETLQAQAQALPALVGQIGSLVQAMQQRDEALTERLLAGQDRFHEHARNAYAELATSVDRTLRQSLTDSARSAGETIRPVAEATLAGIASESAAIQRQLGAAVQQQLDGLATRFDGSVGSVAETWTRALAQHERSSEALAQRLQATLEQRRHALPAGQPTRCSHRSTRRHRGGPGRCRARLVDTAQRAADLHARIADTAALQLEAAAARFGSAADGMAQHWRQSLAAQQQHADATLSTLQRSLDSVIAGLDQRSGTLLANVERSHAALQTDLAAADEQRLAALDRLARGAGALARAALAAGRQ